MNPEPEEYALALQAANGDAEALERLVGRLRVPLFARAYAELRHYEDAQDAVAAALLRICLHIHTLKDPARARQWMHRIVRNEARRLFQARKAQREAATWETASASAPDATPALLRLDIERALKRLPRDHARATALFYLAGLPVGEIARRLGRPEGTIKFWLHQGRQRLSQAMEGYAPMASEWIATIISTEFDPQLLAQMEIALQSAGWKTVNIISDFTAAGHLEQTGEGDSRELHLPDVLQSSRLIVLDEWIAGRSAFELITLLNTTDERKNARLCLFLDGSRPKASLDITIRAAWVSGVDLCLTKPFDLAEFENFTGRIRAALAQPPTA